MKTLLLIDANSLIHRAFHALPPLTSPSGTPSGALYGLSSTLLKILGRRKPEYVAAAFDRPEPTFRKKIFEAYKAQRPKAPDELIEQLEEAHRLFSAFGIPTFGKAGVEADDLIGTLAKRFKQEHGVVRIIILTGDLDTLQLVEDPWISVEALKKGVSETVLYDEAGVRERYNLPPERLADYKGLVGDASDNIPGVRGIGPKTAVRLLHEYGTLEGVLQFLPVSDPAYKKIAKHKKEALLSKKLGTIACDVPLSISLNDLVFSFDANRSKIVSYFRKLGFESLLKRIGVEAVEQKKTSEGVGVDRTALPRYAVVEGDECSFPGKILLVAYDWKNILKKNSAAVGHKLFDILIAAWLLDPDQKDLSLSSLSRRFLGQKEEGRGQNVISDLFAELYPKMRAYGLEKVFYKIEMPLVPVLADLESRGISVDREALKNLGREVQEEIGRLTKEIYAAAGERFNIHSPKQVGEVLFGKLGVGKKGQKTKTGARSTAESVLVELKGEHPIIKKLLAYREDTKILSTYVKPLISFAGENGLIHTTFLQTGTGTGRISSERPNLQNIPRESKWSVPLRRAFVPARGKSFVSFDYSQLELRLLAHLTNDKALVEVFKRGQDIHAITAARVLGISESSVTKEERRMGKTLNFGIVYGMGPRAFAKTSALPFDEARRFIEEYFQKFPGVKRWRERTAAEAAARGYGINENGRRRWFSQAKHKGPRGAAEIERAAINMPVQSLEADVLKIAMVNTHAFLSSSERLSGKARMVLSIHDELIFEIADDILEETARKIVAIMEKSYPVSVPLTVDVKAGKNWGEMHKLDV